ncbi:archaemetzincin family Zn-dependent metalloprotease [candidate division KSB1 bacterium]|nr:archaemetzincin family Zn-dependent metalloprotease [candidate division KSB1 bacterium]
MAKVHILPIEYPDKSNLPELANAVANEFRWPVVVDEQPFDMQFALDERRKQYNSSQILVALHSVPIGTDDKIIAVTTYDLFIPILTFVFGEAQLDGPTAVVSIFRLRQEFYGLPLDNTLLEKRLIKETIHELGHTFGLHHCSNYTCVLNASTYVEEIDLKSQHFCDRCRQEIELKTRVPL